jgi:hypothetical protein
MGDALEAALKPLISSLEADGYGAIVEAKPGLVLFRIVAGPEACADCLSPRSILEPMIVKQLRKQGFQEQVQLEYPEGEG